MHTGNWWENLKERDHFEDLAVDGSKKMDFKSNIEGLGGVHLG
jgi:hypothetical protein